MSPAETTVFDIPTIGDDLSAKDGYDEAKYTIARIKRAVDACPNPPKFRGTKTPITGLLDPEDKSKCELHAQGNEKKDKLQSRQNTTRDAQDPRPAHEKQANFPPGPKRPDPTSTVDCREISNDAQRQLFDDIKSNHCTRCHKEDHHRAKCTLPPAKWEEKFDREKGKYWESVLKWQAKAVSEHKTGAPPLPKPTLVPKKESRRTKIAVEYLSEDDDAPLQCCVHFFPDSESEDESMATRYIVYSDSDNEAIGVDPPALAPPSPVLLPEPDPSFPVPAHYEDLAEEVASFVASVALPGDHNWETLNSAPFQVIARGPLLTSIVFADGRSRVMDTAAVDAYLRSTTQTPTPPLQPPPPPLLPPLLPLAPTPVLNRH
jgi:hypothetical protein